MKLCFSFILCILRSNGTERRLKRDKWRKIGNRKIRNGKNQEFRNYIIWQMLIECQFSLNNSYKCMALRIKDCWDK